MSPDVAEAVVLDHLAISLPTLTDTQLAKVAAEHAVEQGHYAAEARRLINAEFDTRHPIADVITASGFDNFRAALVDATDEQVTATAAYWADRTGFIAATHRELISKEFEFRQATQHDIETAHAALVAAMAPPTRWGTER